jgi:hypothetical protein
MGNIDIPEYLDRIACIISPQRHKGHKGIESTTLLSLCHIRTAPDSSLVKQSVFWRCLAPGGASESSPVIHRWEPEALSLSDYFLNLHKSGAAPNLGV